MWYGDTKVLSCGILYPEQSSIQIHNVDAQNSILFTLLLPFLEDTEAMEYPKYEGNFLWSAEAIQKYAFLALQFSSDNFLKPLQTYPIISIRISFLLGQSDSFSDPQRLWHQSHNQWQPFLLNLPQVNSSPTKKLWPFCLVSYLLFYRWSIS